MREVLMCHDDEGLEVLGPEEDLADSRGAGVLVAARCVLRVPAPAPQALSPYQSFLGCGFTLAVLLFI